VILLLTLTGVQAQADRGSRCQPLVTEFGLLYGNWRWLDSDTVEFGVWNGFPDDSMTKSRYAWYRYHPSSGILEKLSDNPYDELNLAGTSLAAVQLKNVQAGFIGLYDNVNISPNRKIIVYSRQDGDTLDTWVIAPDAKIDTALGIGGGYVDVIWREDEQQFLLTGLDNASNVLGPIQLVTLTDGKVSVQQLDKLKLIAGVFPKAFNVFGISPDGQYIVITPETNDYRSWVLDLNQQKASMVEFLLIGSKVVWTSPTTFIGIANGLGAIRYDIETGKQEVLAQPSEIGQYEPNLPEGSFTAGGGPNGLSPNGQYLMAQGKQDVKREIVVCKIY